MSLVIGAMSFGSFLNHRPGVEVVIMRDRAIGRARGFGFMVFADSGVAECEIIENHMINVRMVEAKKAVPRDDQQALSKSGGSVHGSLGPSCTKKFLSGVLHPP